MNDIEAIKRLKDAMQDCTSGEDEPYKQAFGIAILSLEKQLNNGWIPTNIELPEKYLNQHVYVTMKHKDGNYTFSARLFWKHGKFEWFNGKPVSDKWRILAWMEEKTPEPYKEGE